MNKTIFTQFFQEYINGIWKGSMNRFLAFLFASTIIFCGVYPLIHTSYKDIPLEFIGILVSLIVGLLGISGYNKYIDIKSTTPNPNLPDPNKIPQANG